MKLRNYARGDACLSANMSRDEGPQIGHAFCAVRARLRRLHNRARTRLPVSAATHPAPKIRRRFVTMAVIRDLSPGGATIMAAKTEFTPGEWKSLLRIPPVAGIAP